MEKWRGHCPEKSGSQTVATPLPLTRRHFYQSQVVDPPLPLTGHHISAFHLQKKSLWQNAIQAASSSKVIGKGLGSLCSLEATQKLWRACLAKAHEGASPCFWHQVDAPPLPGPGPYVLGLCGSLGVHLPSWLFLCLYPLSRWNAPAPWLSQHFLACLLSVPVLFHKVASGGCPLHWQRCHISTKFLTFLETPPAPAILSSGYLHAQRL